MLPPDLVELAEQIAFRQPAAALAHLTEMAQDPAEMLALAQLREHLAEALSQCADPDAGLRNLSRFVQAWGVRLPLLHLFRDHPAALDALLQVIAASRYLADVLVRNPEFFDLLGDSSRLRTPRELEELAEDLDKTCAPFASGAAQLDVVRRFRRREILRIGAADLLGLVNLRQTTEQLSYLADAVVRQCLAIVSEAGGASGLIVLALGKLGGSELNYSSDIDLVYLVDDQRLIEAATRQAQRLTAALGETSGEGFLYRVDLRLRPFGGAGALVVSTDMMLDYLASQAHPAERQAMLKARVVAGPADAGGQFLERAKALLAADAPDARRQVRQLKERIERQLASRGHSTGHVKLAPGGIRDIEFIVQALQIEAAHQQPELAAGNTLSALSRLAAASLISRTDAGELQDAYVFLRLVEHRLQLMDNQQVHRLPDDPLELRVLSRSLRFDGPDEGGRLQAAYGECVHSVRAIFEQVMDASRGMKTEASSDPELHAAVRSQVGAFAEGLDGNDLQRHVDLLAEIRQPQDVQVLAQRESHQYWTVSIAARDCVGILSLVTGLFAAEGISVLSGDVFTLRFPGEAPPPSKSRRPPTKGMRSHEGAAITRKILDIFSVRADRWLNRSYWRQFESELGELVTLLAAGKPDAAREKIIERVSQAAHLAPQAEVPLYPVAVELDNHASESLTRLSIRSTDTIGFLFEFTSSLAALGMNVERVEIRTVNHEVRDTFWITDERGRKIRDEDRLHELRAAAALIKQFTHLLPRSPDPAQALRQFSALARQLLSRPDWTADLASLESQAALGTLAELLGASEFLWEDFLRMQHENLFPVLRDIPALDQKKSKAQLERELAIRAGQASGLSHDEEVAQLNRFKDREMFRIDLRHITRRIDVDEFSGELSDLAEVVVAAACKQCHERLGERHGMPRLADGRQCRRCVCALGKFGGRELGFASDIELLFVYEGEGTTDGPQPIANARYFEEFVSEFLRTLSTRREGIFEIDLRLRPHGKAGTLACSLAGFGNYYSASGAAEQFERLALVKLRLIAGDPLLAERIVQARDGFVYSGQPIDFENIRHLRRRQADELVAHGRTSAKHSLGGLVDLEYYIQVKQIEVGSADSSVRVTNTEQAIDRLQASRHLTPELAQSLTGAYQFLRQLIEALRVVRGHAKDLTIPSRNSLAFAHLSRRLGYDSPSALELEIERQMSFAREIWNT